MSQTWTPAEIDARVALAIDAYFIANPPSGSGDFVKAVDDTDDITEGATKKFATQGEKDKLALVSVTQAVDLDTMESDIAGKSNVGHGHAISDVTGLQTALDGKAPALGGDDNYVTDAEKTKLGTLVAPQTFVLGSDVATGANVTPVTLTGLVFTYEANSVYRISFMGRVQPGAATTGCGFQFDLSSAVTDINVSFYHQLASTGTLSGGHSIADDASVGVSSGLPATGTYPVVGDAILRTGANTGTAQLRFRSETTAVITAKAGLVMVVEKIA